MVASIYGKIAELAERAATMDALDVVDLSYAKEGRSWVLRVLADRAESHPQADQGGITLEECGQLSSQLAGLLEVEDVMPGPYRLEVSSPGVNRPLKKEGDFARFQGRMAVVRASREVDGRRYFKGVLQGVAEGHVLLEMDLSLRRIPLDAIDRAHLEFHFETPQEKKDKAKRRRGDPIVHKPESNNGI